MSKAHFCVILLQTAWMTKPAAVKIQKKKANSSDGHEKPPLDTALKEQLKSRLNSRRVACWDYTFQNLIVQFRTTNSWFGFSFDSWEVWAVCQHCRASVILKRRRVWAGLWNYGNLEVLRLETPWHAPAREANTVCTCTLTQTGWWGRRSGRECAAAPWVAKERDHWIWQELFD